MERTFDTVRLPSGTVSFRKAGRGRPMLYLHPLGGLRWTRVLDRLAETHTIYAPVMPGFDGSAVHPGVASGAALGGLVAAFVDAIVAPADPAPIDVYGHSFGGWVALWFAAQHPARVANLVLEAAAGFRPADAPPPPADPAAFQRALWLHPENHVRDLRAPGADAGNPAMRAHYGLPGAADAALAGRLDAVRCRTLILAGAHDVITPPVSQRALARHLVQSALVPVEDAAHGIAVDRPDHVHALVERFLEGSAAFEAAFGNAVAPR